MEQNFIKVIQKTLNNEEDKKFNIYIQSEWTPKLITFRFQETHRHKCYRGELTDHDLHESAKELDIPYEDFRQQCYDALTNINVNALHYQYEIDNHGLCFKLYKKVNFMMEYLEIKIKLLKHPYEIYDNVIEQLNNQQNNSTIVAIKSNVSSNHNYDEIIKELNECIQDRKVREFCLMSKFLRILNAKKEKIRKMKTIIDLLNEKKSTKVYDDDNDMVEDRQTTLDVEKNDAEYNSADHDDDMVENQQTSSDVEKNDAEYNSADDSFNAAMKRNYQNRKDSSKKQVLDDNDSDNTDIDGSPSTSKSNITIKRRKVDYIDDEDDVTRDIDENNENVDDDDDDYAAQTEPLFNNHELDNN